MFDTLFGLPAHPLVVHLPVVFIPLTLILAILAVAWARGRRVLSLVLLLATAGFTTVWGARAGHLGAKATWHQLPRSSGGGGDDVSQATHSRPWAIPYQHRPTLDVS